MRVLPLLGLLASLFLSASALAQGQVPSNGAQQELVIGTRVAPPFAMKRADGEWEGISIDLWRHLAERLGLHYRLEERDTVQALLDAVTNRQVDAAVAALTVTAARRQAMDFTQPFFATGLGVAVGRGGATAWLPVLRTFLSFGFLQGVLTLLGIALLVGTLIWLFERKSHDAYGGPPLRGFVAGAWWSAVAMTQAGAAQDGPRTLPGRILAVVWMVASVVTIAVFIAGITSALTTQRLQGVVRNTADLRAIRVGAVGGSSTIDFLGANNVGFEGYGMPAQGLRALKSGRIDAFVYDRALLTWTIKQDFPELEVLPLTLDSQSYAIALPLDAPLRVALDVALLDTLRSEWWTRTRLRYLGNDGVN